MQAPATLIEDLAPVEPQLRRAWEFDRETRDFAMYLDGELVGFARTPREAEDTLNELVHEILTRAYGKA